MPLYVCTQCGFKTKSKDDATEHRTFHESPQRVSVRLIKAIPGLIFSVNDITDFTEDYAHALIRHGYAVAAYQN